MGLNLNLIAQIAGSNAMRSFSQRSERVVQHLTHKRRSQQRHAQHRKDGVKLNLSRTLRDALFGLRQGNVRVEYPKSCERGWMGMALRGRTRGRVLDRTDYTQSSLSTRQPIGAERLCTVRKSIRPVARRNGVVNRERAVHKFIGLGRVGRKADPPLIINDANANHDWVVW